MEYLYSSENYMQKYLSYMVVFFIFTSLAACGGSSGSTVAAVPIYDSLPTSFASYSASGAHLMGGSKQGGSIASKFATYTSSANYSVSTFAGTPECAGFINYSTTNGPAAKFNHPTDITTDGTNFFVSDYGNNLIRKITPSGAVSTLPILLNHPSGNTTDGNYLYVVNSGANTILFIELATNAVTTIGSSTGLSGSVDSTIPADVRFNQPTGITTDGVNLYVTDTGNQTVRRINIATKAVSTMAGTSGAIGSNDGVQGAARFNVPGRITTDRKNLYLTDFNNRTIRKIDILTEAVTTIAGILGTVDNAGNTADGIGAVARFNQPNGITTDGTYVYVTDLYQNTVRRIEKTSPYNVTTISGISGTAGVGGSVDSPGIPSFYNPIGITTDGISLFVVDSFNNTIRKID